MGCGLEQGQRRKSRCICWFRWVVVAIGLTLLVLIAALWMRSYWVQDNVYLQYTTSHTLLVASTNGRISVTKRWPMNLSQEITVDHTRPGIGYGSGYPDDFGRTPDLCWFRILRWKNGLLELSMPDWILVTLSAAIFVIALPRRRFGLRALFYAITLSALACGLGTLPFCLPR